jgi:hypothetical protein
VTESENHFGHRDEISRETLKSVSDVGGDFTTERKSVVFPVTPALQTVSSGWYTNTTGRQQRDSLTGVMLPFSVGSMPFPPSARSSESTLAALGTTAISRCAPTNNVADLATALIELYREGIPAMLGSHLWQSRLKLNLKNFVKGSSNEYLKGQFGWKPLLGDIKDVAKVISKSQRLLEQAYRDSGRVVRRRYQFSPTRVLEESLVATGLFYSTFVSGISLQSVVSDPPLGGGSVFRYRETTKRQWFSGAFTYHMPNYADDMWGNSHQAIDLLGLELTPETVWNATPWSWAVDWFSSVGDVIHNLNSWSKYGLVLKYGYIMEHSRVSDVYTYSGPTGYKSAGVHPLTVELVTETKIRRRATPYGFGLTMGSLNNTQKAITAALGLSRVK